MGLWQRLKNKFWPDTATEPIEVTCVREVAKGFRAGLTPMSMEFVHIVSLLARKRKLHKRYVMYVWWCMKEQPGEWPSMSPFQRLSLSAGLDLVWAERDLPPYGLGFDIPPGEQAAIVDEVILQAARWCERTLVVKAATIFFDQAQKQGKRLFASDPDKYGTISEAQDWLVYLCHDAVIKHPDWYAGLDVELHRTFLWHLFQP